jgi:hypothetical protein
MSRTRLILLSLLSVFAFSATVASSASAFAWWVEKEGGGGEEILAEGVKEFFNNEALVHTPFKLKGTIAGVAFESICSGAGYEEGYIEGFVGFGAKTIKFGACSVAKPANCKIEGEKFQTTELVGNIKKASGNKVEFELKPKTGTKFAAFNLEGPVCARTVELGGTARGEITNPKEITKEKSFLFQTKESGLTITGGTVNESTGQTGYSASRGWGAS